MVTDEVLKEGQVVEYSQPPSQDTKVQAAGSTEVEAIEGEPSQKEMTPSRSDKGKEVVEHTPSSSRAKSLAEHIPIWIRKEIMRSTNPQFHASEEEIFDIKKILNKPKSPSHETKSLAFVTSTQD